MTFLIFCVIIFSTSKIKLEGDKMNILKTLFGNYSKREVKRIQPLCDAVLALEETYRKMSDKELKSQTQILRDKLKNGATLDDILPEAFATCREASTRVLGMTHFPVQIIGGIILHQGRSIKKNFRIKTF